MSRWAACCRALQLLPYASHVRTVQGSPSAESQSWCGVSFGAVSCLLKEFSKLSGISTHTFCVFLRSGREFRSIDFARFNRRSPIYSLSCEHLPVKSDYLDVTKMIKGIFIINNNGKPRLMKTYDRMVRTQRARQGPRLPSFITVAWMWK